MEIQIITRKLFYILSKRTRGQRTACDYHISVGYRGQLLMNYRDIRIRNYLLRHKIGEFFSVNSERTARRNSSFLSTRDDQRTETAHFLFKQSRSRIHS